MKIAYTKALGIGLVSVFMGVLPVNGIAEVYTWKDAQGRVHFGDKAPLGTAAETIDLPEVDPSAIPSMTDAERRERQRKVIESIASEREAREEAREKSKKDKATRIATCNKAKKRIEESKGINLFYTRDSEGNKVYMTDEQRKAADALVLKKYQQECGGL